MKLILLILLLVALPWKVVGAQQTAGHSFHFWINEYRHQEPMYDWKDLAQFLDSLYRASREIDSSDGFPRTWKRRDTIRTSSIITTIYTREIIPLDSVPIIGNFRHQLSGKKDWEGWEIWNDFVYDTISWRVTKERIIERKLK